MSFHFQPQADSSEDEEQVDLATWQTGAAQKQKSPINAAAVDVGEEEADEEDKDEEQLSAFMDPASNDDVQAADSGANEEEDADEDEEEPQVGEDFLVLSDNDEVIELDSPRDASAKPGRKRQSLPFVSPGFTSINAPVQISSGEDESESQDEEIEVSRNGRKVVVPIVPRIQLDSEEEEEIEDFTKGGDVVRKVLKETKEGRRGVKYTVEFGDWHVEAVSFSYSISRMLRCSQLRYWSRRMLATCVLFREHPLYSPSGFRKYCTSSASALSGNQFSRALEIVVAGCCASGLFAVYTSLRPHRRSTSHSSERSYDPQLPVSEAFTPTIKSLYPFYLQPFYEQQHLIPSLANKAQPDATTSS